MQRGAGGQTPAALGSNWVPALERMGLSGAGGFRLPRSSLRL